jgi:hypothetical protein
MKAWVRIGAVLGAALLLTSAGHAAEQAAIQRAIEAGVSSLKSQQQSDGGWSCRDPHATTAGMTAICGLALLECDVKPDDPVMKKAAKLVREQSLGLTGTYSLSTAIMFLDRLGDPADAELIDSMAIRLLAGQNGTDGGWGYDCPSLGAAEVQRLQAQLQGRAELVARSTLPEGKGRPTVGDLPKEMQDQLKAVGQQQAAGGMRSTRTDNSNTQFAVLALWIARRHGIPVELALHRLDARFRSTQQVDGGWLYSSSEAFSAYGSTPQMTCAGLLGLALAHGNNTETTLRAGVLPGAGAPRPRAGTAGVNADILKDPVVQKALVHLAAAVQNPWLPNPPQAVNGPMPVLPSMEGRSYYYLFSLERVCVIYGLENLGGKVWYDWGADYLLSKGAGSWTGEYESADTCFALLFLRRANLAKDLTAIIKAGQHNLHAGTTEDLQRTKPKAGAGDTTPPPAPRDTPRPADTARPAPAAPADAAVGQLGDELVNADAGKQDVVIAKLRDSKGAQYTDALAYAIHKLDGLARSKARDALADRLTRMSAKTLTDKLGDDDLEVRRAAALAIAMKDEKDLVPRLIERLEDPEPPVTHAAHAALKSLTRQDFGPGPDAARADVARAVAAWKAWWSKNGGR